MKFINIFVSALIGFSALSGAISGNGMISEASETNTQKDIRKYSPVAGQFGGERNFSINTSPKTFNIYLSTDPTINNILNFMYDGLVETNPLTLETTPQLAESWEISEDKMNYTIKLKEGLKWSDGQQLTADDVVFTFNEILGNADIPNNYRDNLLIEEQLPVIEKVDKLHIKFMTPVPFASFLQKLNFPLLPSHILSDAGKKNSDGEILFKGWGKADSSPESIVCNGPFKLEKYDPGKSIILERNNNYWKINTLEQRLPFLDRIKISIINDPILEYTKFLEKESDSLFFTAKLGRLLKPKEKELNFTIHSLEQTSGSLAVMFNLSTAKDKDRKQLVNPVKSGWFKNPNFRKALAYSLDKKALIKNIYNGFAFPQYSSFSQNNPFFNPAIEKYRFDLKKAAQLLKDSGFKKNAKGELVDSQGNKVEFKLAASIGNSVRDKTSQLIAANWKKLGIKVNYTPVKFEELLTSMEEKLDWDAVLVGLPGNNTDLNEGLNTWKLAGSKHLFNTGNSVRNPHWLGMETNYEKWERDIEDLYQKASAEFDPIKRKELYFKAQAIESENLPFIYTAQPVPFVAVRNNIGNIFPAINAGNDLNAINWNIEEQFIKK